ncbi:DnrO protein [Dokdonella sp.]|uniref:DnrO protein n=1 Tax=Dokdonella sp. TaxID=2291710 RepID=UPI003529CAA8
MKAFILALLVPLACPAAQARHEHEHDGQTLATAATANPARRFETDAPLREGMGRIHQALNELRHYEMGHMPESIAVEKVDEIQSSIDYLFANCKLPTDADAALHAILVPLLDAVNSFDKDPKDMAALASMRKAVDDYPHRFIDPDWPLPGTSAEHAGH